MNIIIGLGKAILILVLTIIVLLLTVGITFIIRSFIITIKNNKLNSKKGFTYQKINKGGKK